LFPGQGVQLVRSGQALYAHEPVFRAALDQCAALFAPHLGLDLRQVLYPDELRMEDGRARMEERESSILDPPSSILDQTRYAQPALFALEYALAQQWMSWGVQPAALLGHSLGEYVAACLAGVFSLEAAVRLVAARGRLMQQTPSGELLAVRASAAELGEVLGEGVELAAENSPQQCVVGGEAEVVGRLAEELAWQGVATRQLGVGHAFHTGQMEGVLGE
jgi:acyl transferase domain-containing protein